MRLIAIGVIEYTDPETEKLAVANPGAEFSVTDDTGKRLLAMKPPVVREAEQKSKSTSDDEGEPAKPAKGGKPKAAADKKAADEKAAAEKAAADKKAADDSDVV